MDKSGIWACVIAGVMIATGGYLAWQGYDSEERKANDTKLKNEQDDLESTTKKAAAMEDRLTKLSAALGFHDLTNWFGRAEYYDKWTKEIQNDPLASKLQEYGVDTSKRLSSGEIALFWALKMQQSEKPMDVYRDLLSTDDGFKATLRSSVESVRAEFDKKATPEMPPDKQEEIEQAHAVAAAKLDPGRKPWSSPDALKKLFETWPATVDAWKAQNRLGDAAPTAATNVKDLLDSLDQTIVKLQEKIAATNKARDDERKKLLAIIGETDEEGRRIKGGSMADEEQRKDASIKQLQEEITSLRVKIGEEIRSGEAELMALDREISEETAKLNMMVAEKRRRTKELEAKLSDTKERLAKLRARQAAVVEATEADGKLLWVDLERGIAHVDIGRAHTLFRGTRFEIYRIVKAGKKKRLGEMEVLDLGEERSRVAIVSVADPSDPPAAGDLVSNVAFERNKPKVFSIAGQLKYKFSRDEMRRRLAEWGARLADDVDPNTSILIVGDRYRDDPNWQRALDIGTPIMRERELYDALGLD